MGTVVAVDGVVEVLSGVRAYEANLIHLGNKGLHPACTAHRPA
jgi:hypothetical protein